MQTLPNGIEVPTNSDTYKLTEDLANMGDTANVITKFISKTARDAFPSPEAGDVGVRTDVVGLPLEIFDGVDWLRHIPFLIYANTQTVGSGMFTEAFTTGGLRPILQIGTYVGTTTPSTGAGTGGDLTITYPKPFPNGVIGGIGFSGDGTYIVSATPTSVAMPTTSSLFLRFANPGGSLAANTLVRGMWIAVGW